MIERNGDSFTLQYRDYPQLPKFVRHRSGIALMCPPTDQSLAFQIGSGCDSGPSPLPANRAPLSPPSLKSGGPIMDTKTARIRALNDELRQNFTGGTAVMTTGIAALGAEAVARIVKTIAVFDDFCHANDPHEEHDFGSFDADGHMIFFKIDYFDKTFNALARSSRSLRYRARHHDHAGGGILSTRRQRCRVYNIDPPASSYTNPPIGVTLRGLLRQVGKRRLFAMGQAVPIRLGRTRPVRFGGLRSALTLRRVG